VGYQVSGTDNFTVDTAILFVDTLNNRVGIGLPTPGDALEVIGSVRISGSINASSINTTGGALFALNSGNVGIGTSTPLQKLVVLGAVNISGDLNVTGTVQATRFIGDGSLITGLATGSLGAFNSSGLNIFLNESASRLGLGTITPIDRLDVIGNIRSTGGLNLNGTAPFINFSGSIISKSGADIIISD
jgi:cytoskeletal protein CcmA (bactofilin family)